MTQRFALLALASFLAACAATARQSAAPPVAPTTAEPAPGVPHSWHAAPMPPAEQPEQTGYSDVNTDNSLISNGSVTASSEQLLSTASGFRRELYRLGGRVFSEAVHYRSDVEDEKQVSSAQYRVKLLPRMLPDLIDWLGKHSTITAQDVSSIIAMESEGDAAIVRPDVRARLAEIDAQLADASIEPQVKTALDVERNRLVGSALADPNAMADNTKRVAVLDVRIEAPRTADPYAHGKLLGHARGSVLGLGVLGTARDNRFGGGVGIGGRSPVSRLEVMGYSAPTMETKPGVSVTLGIGGYAKALGGGNRSSFNPYVGARFGYAYLQASYAEVAAELGIELVKQKGVLWTVSARPIGLFGSSSQGAVEVGSSVGLAF